MIRTRWLCLLVAGFPAAGCTGAGIIDDAFGPAATITPNPTTVNVPEGQSTTIGLTFKDAKGNTLPSSIHTAQSQVSSSNDHATASIVNGLVTITGNSVGDAVVADTNHLVGG